MGVLSKNSSAAGTSINAHETGSFEDEEEFKTDEGTSMNDHEEFDIDKMINDIEDDDYDFM